LFELLLNKTHSIHQYNGLYAILRGDQQTHSEFEWEEQLVSVHDDGGTPPVKDKKNENHPNEQNEEKKEGPMRYIKQKGFEDSSRSSDHSICDERHQMNDNSFVPPGSDCRKVPKCGEDVIPKRKEIKNSRCVSKRGKDKKRGRKPRIRKMIHIKNPKAPCRFRTCFILFWQHNQEKIRKTVPDGSWKAQRSAHKAGEIWHALPEKEKEPWREAARIDKIRFYAEKKEFNGDWKIFQIKKKKDPTAPKKNSSSFLIFCRTRRKAVRQRNPHTENKYIVRMLSEEWNKLTVEEKRPYQEIEMKEREMYLQKMNEWKKKEELKKDMLEREVVASKIKLHTEVLDAPALSQLAQPTPSHEPTPSQKPTPSHEPTPSQKPTPSHEPTPSQKPTPSHEPTPSQKPTPIHEPTPIHHPNTSMMASQ